MPAVVILHVLKGLGLGEELELAARVGATALHLEGRAGRQRGPSPARRPNQRWRSCWMESRAGCGGCLNRRGFAVVDPCLTCASKHLEVHMIFLAAGPDITPIQDLILT
ncbi:MAG TPA: hypothetical protein VMW11_11025, partial [Candidatus Dormibacteraeota bacterium]|nr:hypothetical protein [Candidatus Dormibacteraeota bacterium]